MINMREILIVWFLRVADNPSGICEKAKTLFKRFKMQTILWKKLCSNSFTIIILPETVRPAISTFLTTGDGKPCNIGRPSGSATLFPHEES